MLSSLAVNVWDKLLWLFSWSTLQSAIGIAFALGLVIFIHELGHYAACLLLKIKVEEFSIGFGKLIKKWQRGETQYSLRAVPLGGFVKPKGEFYAREADIKDLGEFAAKPWYIRSIMVFAGAGMNYVLAFVIFFFVIITMGLPVSDPKQIHPEAGEIISGYPAAEAGMKPGDLILSVDNTPVANWQELVKILTASPEGGVSIEYKRAGQTVSSVIELTKDKKLGLTVAPVYEKTGFFEAIKTAGHQCYYWTALSLKTIAKKLWAGQAPDLAGPIGIFEIVGKGVHSGVEDYFYLIGLISVAIGMFNLFPIPILDGGHILFFIIEGIRGKRVKEKTLYRASSVGAVLLISLVIFATYKDITRISAHRKAAKAAVERQAGQDEQQK